jgi:hypothetical protein
MNSELWIVFLFVACETGEEIKPTSDGLSGWDLLVEAAG